MFKTITFALYALTATDAYQLDSGITGAECTATIEALVTGARLVEIVPGREWQDLASLTLTCELEKPIFDRRADRH